MSARLAAAPAASAGPPFAVSSDPRRVAILRAVAALVWAAALAVAAGRGDVGPELSVGLAALVTAYPLIDVVASLVGGARVNALVSTVAVAGLAVAAFGSDVGAVLAVFGAWAVVSGALQLAAAVQRRRRAGAGAAGSRREVPMIVSGGLSTLAGLSFVASSGADDPSLTALAGYAAVGAVLFLAWALRHQGSSLKR